MRRTLLLSLLCLVLPELVQGGELSEHDILDSDTGGNAASGDLSALDRPGALPTEPVPASSGELEYLVPSLRGRTFHLSGGARPYLNRLGFSPGFGRLGGEPLYNFRLSYAPNSWLGYEASIGHNRGKSVHALVHSLNAQLRYPIPFRVQPYATFGFGMILVFPGPAVNASPVTKNVLSAGGGVEIFLRDDLALRGEMRRLGVFGRDPLIDEDTVYGYGEGTLGLSFYRRLEQ